MNRNRALAVSFAALLLGLLANGAFASLTEYEQVLANQGVVLYYNFEEPTGAQYALASGPGVDPVQNELLYNSPQTKQNVPGVVGGAVQFGTGGATAVQGINHPANALVGSGAWTGWTCEFWYNPGSSFSDYGTYDVYQGMNGPYFHFSFGSIFLGLSDGSYGSTHQSIDEYPLDIPLNQWSLLAETFDGTTERFYVNGVLSATLIASDINNGIGEPSTDWDAFEFTSGPGSVEAIDELDVFSKPLTAQDFQAQIDATIPEPGLISLLALGGVFMVWRRKVASSRA